MDDERGKGAEKKSMTAVLGKTGNQRNVKTDKKGEEYEKKK